MDFALMHDKAYRRHLTDVPYASVATLQIPDSQPINDRQNWKFIKIVTSTFFHISFSPPYVDIWIMHDAKQR